MASKNGEKGHPVLFSIMIGIVLTVLVSVASAAAQMMEWNERGTQLSQAAAFFLMAVFVTVYMIRKDRTLSAFGFGRIEWFREKRVLFYIPLLLIALVQPAIGGLNPDLSLTDVLVILLFTFLVGYTEETVFRGVIREQLKGKGSTFYIVFSSIFFGLLHMANAFSGNDLTQVILQVVNAFLIGLILALLIETTGKILPLILFHFLYDALAFMTGPGSESKELLVISVLNILYALYGAFLLVARQRRKQSVQLPV